jgi:hypothetical protein
MRPPLQIRGGPAVATLSVALARYFGNQGGLLRAQEALFPGDIVANAHGSFDTEHPLNVNGWRALKAAHACPKRQRRGSTRPARVQRLEFD